MSIKKIITAISALALCALSCQALSQALASPTPLATPTEAAKVTLTPSHTLESPYTTGWNDWQSPSFNLTDKNLWRQSPAGCYTATGSADTFAWSEEIASGDVVISLEVESRDPLGQGVIVVYGDGSRFSKEGLFFNIAADEQSIKAYSYAGLMFLSDLCYEHFDFISSKHTVIIEIVDNYASLYVDGNKLSLTNFLNSEINQSGKIGLSKSRDRPEVIYSNIRVKTRSTNPLSTITPIPSKTPTSTTAPTHTPDLTQTAMQATKTVEAYKRIEQLREQALSVCQGAGLTEAADWDSSSEAVNPAMICGEDTCKTPSEYFSDERIAKWDPKDISDLRLVVCEQTQTSVVGTCVYTVKRNSLGHETYGNFPIDRVQESFTFRIFSAQTRKSVGYFFISGEIPPPCPKSFSLGGPSPAIRGKRPNIADVLQKLNPYLHLPAE